METKNPVEVDWGLKPLHDKMLEMITYIHFFCEKFGIDYCLAYGTALGAVRHQGFIPWDDDIDIYMTSSSYEVFKREFALNGDHNKYFFQEINPIDGMVTLTKLRMNNTTFIEPLFKNCGLHQGIYLDIFILRGAPKSMLKRRIMCLANQYLVLKGLSNRKYKKKALFRPLLAFMRLFPKDFLCKSALSIIYKYDNKDADVVFDSDLRTFKKSFYDRKLIFPAKISKFEDIQLYIPGNCHKYLENAFGDYMKVPDYDKIKRTQHAFIWDVKKDYTEYLNEEK